MSKQLIDEGKAIAYWSKFMDLNKSESTRNAIEFTKLVCINIHNISKLPESKAQYEEAGINNILKHYLVPPAKDKTQITALCAIALLLSDSPDSASLVDETDVIPKLLRTLKRALSDSKHRYLGFSVEELAEGLAALAVNDQNKEKIAANGAIDILVKMLQGNDEAEFGRAVDCLWALSFKDEIRMDILKNENCMKGLEMLSKNESISSELRTRAGRALEFVKVGQQQLGEHVKSGDGSILDDGHIFISYQWTHQKVVLQIRQYLLDKGFKIWMDVDNMTNNTLEAMASGVEQAKLILICYSEHYKQSNMCRTEAEYVFRLGKPFIPINMEYRYFPTGWLGIIIGARLYVDFSLHKHPMNVVFGRLDNEISSLTAKVESNGDSTLPPSKQLQKSSHQHDEPQTPSKHEQNSMPCNGQHSMSCPSCNVDLMLVTASSHQQHQQQKQQSNVTIDDKRLAEIRVWTELDVDNWLKQINLEHLKLVNFDGEALIGLYNMKIAVRILVYPCLRFLQT